MKIEHAVDKTLLNNGQESVRVDENFGLRPGQCVCWASESSLWYEWFFHGILVLQPLVSIAMVYPPQWSKCVDWNLGHTCGLGEVPTSGWAEPQGK